jgi:hypothetical protein
MTKKLPKLGQGPTSVMTGTSGTTTIVFKGVEGVPLTMVGMGVEGLPIYF